MTPEWSEHEVVMPPPDPLWAVVPTAVAPKLAERARAVQAGEIPITPARPSASVVLVRDAPGQGVPGQGVSGSGVSGSGVQVWMMHRANSMAFAAGAWAFPGGGVDGRDAAADQLEPSSPKPLPRRDPGDELRRCAVREVAEETGLLLDGGALVPWARWVTPQEYPRRYDTWFFLADAAGSEPRNASTEADHADWFAPNRILDDPDAVLFPPTRVILAGLAAADSVARLVADAPSRLTPIMNRVDLSGSEPRLVIEYATGDVDSLSRPREEATGSNPTGSTDPFSTDPYFKQTGSHR